MNEKLRVYVAGPITIGDQFANVAKAIRAGNRLASCGFTVFIPHLNVLWHMLYPHGPDFWLEQDLEWVRQCDAVLRLPGDSKGADEEVAEAELHGIPVFESTEDLVSTFHDRWVPVDG